MVERVYGWSIQYFDAPLTLTYIFFTSFAYLKWSQVAGLKKGLVMCTIVI